MKQPLHRRPAVLMMAQSYYEMDPRVIREAEAAVAAGFDVDFLALRKPGSAPEENVRGVRVIRLNQGKYRGDGHFQYVIEYLKFFLRCFIRATALSFRRRYSVVHVNNMPDFLVFSTIIPRLLGAKVILDIHDPMPNTFASKFKGKEGGFFYRILLLQERLSAAYSSRVITVHHPVRDGILVKHGLAADSVDIIGNFADDKVFNLRKNYSTEGKIRLVFHGTILERSGLRLLMAALAKVRHKERISVKIIGDGDFSHTLKQLIQSLQLGAVVDFDNHSYPVHSIVSRIEDCNVGLVPLEISSVTNFALPLKLIEYISLGLPVVTVRNAAISYYLSEKDCLFFDATDPQSLSDVLDRIAENPQVLSEYRARSVALRSRFSWSAEKRKYMDLLLRLSEMPGREMTPMETEGVVKASLQKTVRWIEEHDYKAYDPGDGDLSFLRYLSFNVHFLRRLLTGAVLRTPFHIRPWIGIRPHRSTKGTGYVAWGYVKLFALTGDPSYRRRAESCLNWLMQNRSASEYYCWGNHFAFSTRAGTIPKHMPTIVWSSLIAQAFLEAYEVFGTEKYLEVAASTGEWIKRLPREKTDKGICLSYVPFKQSSIHNSNMLGAALLARLAYHTHDHEGLGLAREAMRYSCERQRADGSWFYGEEARYRWIDNFHTGYNLDCLKRYIDSSGDREFQICLERGLAYFKSHFFEPDGRPKYYQDKAEPIDIQCAAQAIDTLSFFSDSDSEALELAAKVASWTIKNMQAEDGHFFYRDLGWKKVKTPMFHWGQATMVKALAHLLTKLSHGSGTPVEGVPALPDELKHV